MKSLMERAKMLEAEGIFLGGPASVFEVSGRKLLMLLLREGVVPSSNVLDIGCGCLRGGYWVIHFLDRNRYFGTEPNTQMLDAGIRILLEPEEKELKKPSFSHNEDFDFTVFGTTFDFYLARSIWTHAAKEQIQTMLDGFVKTSSRKGVFLTSYCKPTLFKGDYKGSKWVGKSHESSTPGIVRHRFGWIQAECAARGLVAEEIKEKEYNFGIQRWIRIRHRSS